MLKNIIILFNVFVLLLINALVTADLTITPISPKEVKSGSEFEFEVKINKGDVSGFAKIQQDLPPGFTAEVIDAKGASFTFVGGTVKFIWMSLPADAEFSVKYKVKVGAEVSGDHKIEGKFSFLQDNERKSINIPTHEIKVDGGAAIVEKIEQPAVNNSSTTDLQNTTPTGNIDVQGNPAANGSTPSGDVACARKIDDLGNGEYKVTLEVSSGGLTGFAKAQEEIPNGLKAREDNANGAVFSFVGQKAKFVWMGVPSENKIVASYILSLDGGSAGALKEVDGKFSYLKDNNTLSCDCKTVSMPQGTIANNTTPVQQQSLTTNTSTSPTKTEPKATTPSLTENKTTTPTKTEAKTTTPTKSTTPQQTSTQIADAKGLLYRVQICAGHDNVGNVANYFEKTYKFSGEAISIENHEGWTKYVIGSHNAYVKARDRRNEVTNGGHNFPGPFVTAYNNGKRITVQEALMITREKWVQ